MEPDALEIFTSYLKKKYDYEIDFRKRGIIVRKQKERIISHLRGNLDKRADFHQDVRAKGYALIHPNCVHGHPDGTGDVNACELVRPGHGPQSPHGLFKEREDANDLLKVAATDEYYNIIDRVHKEIGHAYDKVTHIAILKEYVSLPIEDVKKLLNFCVVCQEKRSQRVEIGEKNKEKKVMRQRMKEEQEKRKEEKQTMKEEKQKLNEEKKKEREEMQKLKEERRKERAERQRLKEERWKAKQAKNTRGVDSDTSCSDSDVDWDEYTNRTKSKKETRKRKTAAKKPRSRKRKTADADADASCESEKTTANGKRKMAAKSASVWRKKPAPDALVQYIVLPGDLCHTPKWPKAAIISQACQASTAVLQVFKQDANVERFTSSLDDMQTDVLEARGEEEMRTLSENLKKNDVDHILWLQPSDDRASCLATKPYIRKNVQKHFKFKKFMKFK